MHEQWLRRYGRGRKEILLLGMNPGPFGMVQTGVPFGEIEAVRSFLDQGWDVLEVLDERGHLPGRDRGGDTLEGPGLASADDPDLDVLTGGGSPAGLFGDGFDPNDPATQDAISVCQSLFAGSLGTQGG